VYSDDQAVAWASRPSGINLGMMEALLPLAGGHHTTRLRLAPGKCVEAMASVTLCPRYGMEMIAERRAPGTGRHR
jgi:hypothetical protein